MTTANELADSIDDDEQEHMPVSRSEVAAFIRTLAAEIVSLETTIERLQADAVRYSYKEAGITMQALRAENQRLRDALTICADRNMASGLVKQTALAALEIRHETL